MTRLTGTAQHLLAPRSIALVGASADGPSASADGGHPAGRCHPGLAVRDLDAFHRRMMDKGVRCLQPPRSVFGSRIAQYADPDGLALSVSEERSGGAGGHGGGSR